MEASERKTRNALFEALVDHGDDPGDFELSWDSDSLELKHKELPARFRIKDRGVLSGKWEVCWIVDRDPSDEVLEWGTDLADLLKNLREWLDELAEYVPDRWADFAEQQRRFSAAALEFGENTPFSPAEQHQIAGALKELTAQIQTDHELSEDEILELTKRLDYLSGAAKRVGRLDWRNLMVGTLASAVAGAFLPPETVRIALAGLVRTLGHLIGAPIPQLPPG